jgi:hypothetical protein
MKTRYGFVSNSSSSSFVVVSQEDVTKESIIEGFKVKLGDPLYFVGDAIATEILRGRKFSSFMEFIKNDHGYETIEEAVEDCRYLKELVADVPDILNSKVIEFSVSSEDYDTVSGLLYGNPITIKTDKFVMKNMYD